MKPPAKPPLDPTEPLNLSQARQQLSPLVRRVAGAPHTEVPISVHGKVQAYLISAERMERLRVRERELQYGTLARPRLRGTLQLLGDLEAGSLQASAELETAARRRADRVGDEPADPRPDNQS